MGLTANQSEVRATTKDTQAPSASTTPWRWRGMFRLVLIAAGLLAILGVLLFVGASFWVNQAGSIPAELLEPPKELTSDLPPLTKPARTIKLPRAASGASTVSDKRTYDDIVRAAMRAHPEQAPPLQTYLDLDKIFKDVKSSETFTAPFRKTTKNAQGGFDVTLWEPGDPQTLEQAAWLKAHAPLLESIQHLYEGRMLPVGDYDSDHPWDFPAPAYAPLHNGTWLLAAEARRHADLNDMDGALRPVSAIFSMAGRLRSDPCEYAMPHFLADVGERILIDLIEHETLPEARMQALRGDLARLHREQYPAEALSMMWENDARISRAGYIQLLKQPWNSGFFGYNSNPPTFDIDVGRYLYIPNLPRLDLVALSALRAMDHKRAAPRYLQEIDAFSLKILERYRLAYPEMIAAGPVDCPPDNLIFSQRGDAHYDVPGFYGLIFFTGETHLNLARAALEWKLGHLKAVPLAPGTDLRRDRENPWRDPFTEQPLKVNTTTTATLIYSIGPNLKDEQGQVIYTMYSREVRPGDLVIHLMRN